MRIQLRKEWVIPIVSGVASFAVGVGAGYGLRVLKARKENKAIEEREFDSEGTKHETSNIDEGNVQLGFEFDERTHKLIVITQEIELIMQAFKDEGRAYLDRRRDDIIQSMHEHVVSNNGTDPEVVSIFEEETDDWDLEGELERRNSEEPYIIHADEFRLNDDNYSQSTLTYYAGDDILCDELDVPVYNYKNIVGTLIFGHGSNDPNIVFVCNPKLEAFYEIIFDRGHYQTEVLGQAIEDKLSDEDGMKHSVHKFRLD